MILLRLLLFTLVENVAGDQSADVLDHYMKAVMVHFRIDLKGFPIFSRKEAELMFAN